MLIARTVLTARLSHLGLDPPTLPTPPAPPAPIASLPVSWMPPLVDVASANPESTVRRDLCQTIAADAEAAGEGADLRLACTLPSVCARTMLRTPS